MKNKKSIIFGILLSFISVYFIADLLQLLIYNVWTGGEYNFSFLRFFIINPEKMSKIQSVIILTFPLFYIVVSIQIAAKMLKLLELGNKRFTMLIFIIINVGYLIVNIFVGGFNILLDKSGTNSWAVLSRNLEMSEFGSIAFIFFVIIILMSYLRSFNKIVHEYITYKK